MLEKEAKTAAEVLKKYERAEKIDPPWERVTLFSWNDMLILKAEIEKLSIGNDRYETARLLNPRAWQEAWQLNISTDKKFDEIIDDLKPFVRRPE